MKIKRFYLLVLFCLFNGVLFAQIPQQVEADLLKTLDKINSWNRKELPDTVEVNLNLLSKENDELEKKLEYYGKKRPEIIGRIFKKLGGSSSDDGLLNIFSWDTNMGGTEHVFENIVLYRRSRQINFSIYKAANIGTYVYAYDKLYTLKTGNKTYYLITYYGIFDLYARGEGIKIFSIENDILNKSNLIKTKARFTDHLYYAYNQNKNNEDIMGDSTIMFDEINKTITFPVIDADGHQIDNSIIYKFNGQFFERVKN